LRRNPVNAHPNVEEDFVCDLTFALGAPWLAAQRHREVESGSLPTVIVQIDEPTVITWTVFVG
jgi:hypothetical protein